MGRAGDRDHLLHHDVRRCRRIRSRRQGRHHCPAQRGAACCGRHRGRRPDPFPGGAGRVPGREPRGGGQGRGADPPGASRRRALDAPGAQLVPDPGQPSGPSGVRGDRHPCGVPGGGESLCLSRARRRRAARLEGAVACLLRCSPRTRKPRRGHHGRGGNQAGSRPGACQPASGPGRHGVCRALLPAGKRGSGTVCPKAPAPRFSTWWESTPPPPSPVSRALRPSRAGCRR